MSAAVRRSSSKTTSEESGSRSPRKIKKLLLRRGVARARGVATARLVAVGRRAARVRARSRGARGARAPPFVARTRRVAAARPVAEGFGRRHTERLRGLGIDPAARLQALASPVPSQRLFLLL